jgi:hypothetical protein
VTKKIYEAAITNKIYEAASNDLEEFNDSQLCMADMPRLNSDT